MSDQIPSENQKFTEPTAQPPFAYRLDIVQEINGFLEDLTNGLKIPIDQIHRLVNTSIDNPYTTQEQKDHLLKQILDLSSQSINLLDTLQFLTQIDPESDHQEIELPPLFEDIKNELINELPDIVNFDLVYYELPVLIMNRNKIKFIFKNLIKNGLIFNREPKKSIQIKYTLHAKSDQTVFLVEDNGVGIKEGTQNEIFQPFKSIPETPFSEDKDNSNLGIGLMMVKKTIKTYGGNIWCNPSEEKGSIFYFTLGNQYFLNDLKHVF